MRSHFLLNVGAASLLLFGGISTLTQTANANQTSEAPILMAQAKEAPAFLKGEAPTSGSYTVVTEGGKRYLELTKDFKTDKGPDLQVVLHQGSAPSKNYQTGEYIILGKLQSLTGTQRYEIPATVKLSNYKSVAIWCKKFNVTFGFAPLRA